MKTTIAALLLLLFISCSKTKNDEQPPQDQLPPITQTGANTAGCLINGKVLIPKNGFNSLTGKPSYGLDLFRGPHFNPPNFNDYCAVRIMNLKDKGLAYTVYVHLNNLTAGVGDYPVGQSNGQWYIDGPNNPHIIVQEFNNNIYTGRLFLSQANSGIIKITRFDYLDGKYAGTFNCTAANKDNPAETIQVTEGRFDINVATLNN